MHRALKMILQNLDSFFKKKKKKNPPSLSVSLSPEVCGVPVSQWVSTDAVFPHCSAKPCLFRAGSCADVLSAAGRCVMQHSAGWCLLKK